MSSLNNAVYVTLENGLRIDAFGLDNELVAQPHNYHEAAKACAMAISRRDGAKDTRDRVRAAAYGRIREVLERGGSKVTEAMVNNEIALDKQVRKAEDDYRQACETSDLWDALRESWRQRSDALKALVQLHVSAYMQRPDAGSGTRADAATTGYARNREALAAARKDKPPRATLG